MVAHSGVKGAVVVGIPTEAQRHAMKPTGWVLFMRTFFLYQLLRFIVINLRMIKMIWMSHRGVRTRAVSRIPERARGGGSPALADKRLG